MTTNFTRRGLVGGTAAGAIGLIAAQAAAGGPHIQPDTGQPVEMLGATKGDAVTLPPLQRSLASRTSRSATRIRSRAASASQWSASGTCRCRKSCPPSAAPSM